MSGTDEPLVLVDGWNVIRSRWPNFREERFVDLALRWAEREGVEVVLVFDGRAPEGPQARLVGTGNESADDWMVREVARLRADGRRLRLVSSDRELRRRVEPHVEQTLGGGAFARLLEAVEHDL